MNRTLGANSSRSADDEVEHLGLDRGVEPGGRLVEDQQRRVLRQRHRDHDALLHAARELVRVAAHDAVGVGDLHLAQDLPGPLVRLLRVRAGDARTPRRPGRRSGSSGSARRPGSGRPSRPCVARSSRTCASLRPARSSPATLDRAARDAAVARQVAQDGVRRRRLAAARLADQPVGLALGDRERDAAQDGPPDAAHAVGDLEVAELERGGRRDGATAVIARRPRPRRRRSGSRR